MKICIHGSYIGFVNLFKVVLSLSQGAAQILSCPFTTFPYLTSVQIQIRYNVSLTGCLSCLIKKYINVTALGSIQG